MSENKKPFYKRWWFILIVVVFIIGMIGNAFGEEEPEQAKEQQTEKQEKKSDEKENETKKDQKPSKKSDETAENKQEDDEKSKKDNNKTIAEQLKENDKNVDKAILENGVLILEHEAKSLWSENSLFYSVYDLFETMNEAFKDKSVNGVKVVISTVMVDNKGNESVDPVISYEYSRESFEELNFKNFSNMAYSQQWRILNESDSYFIHPGIYKNLKDEYTNNLIYGNSKN